MAYSHYKAYANIATADAYHAVRPTAAAWGGLTEAQKAAHLLAASDYIDAAYRFRGRKADPNQARQFPRAGQSDVPPQVVQAVLEMALLLPDGGGAAGAAVSVQMRRRVKVGEIETEYQQATEAQSRLYPLIDALLRDWIIPDGLRTGAILAGMSHV